MVRSNLNHNLCTLMEGGKYAIIILYVDNLLLIGDHLANLIYIKEQLEKKFEMSKLGFMKFYIYTWITFIYLPIGVMLAQNSYAKIVLENGKL